MLMEKDMETVKFIDLFCGIGGIRLGMERAGFECVFSCDVNAECQKTYSANFGETPQGDITKIHGADIPDFEVLCAGFPCQPFSAGGKQKGFADDRGTLFFEVCRIIEDRAEEKQPKVILLENVKNLVYHDGRRTLDAILHKLISMGYIPEWRLLNAVDFGVPQNRERIIIVASKAKAFDFGRLMTAKRAVLADFLDNNGEFEFLREDEFTLIDHPVTQEKSGLCFVGYRNKAMRKAGVRPGTEHLSRVHRQTNRIHSVQGSIPTLTSQETSGRYFVMLPDNRVRKLTISECFRIMGFPSDFKRVSAVSEQYKQMGNSVCVPMITAVAGAIRAQYFEEGVLLDDTYGSVGANI
jgi:DNA (cytosine-5)-methyltransferase 1